MSSFASLMAISASHTQASQSQAAAILAERKRKEVETRKKQLEQEKKDKEREAKLRLRHFEKQKEDEERKKRKEEELKALEASVERRKAAEREILLHGPPRKGTSSSSQKSSAASSQARRKHPSDDNDDDVPKSEPLTREELRERKLQAELRKSFITTKRSSITAGYQKHGRKLPGGAVDVTTNGVPASKASSSQSVKARLAAMPNTLTKLNTVKRDTRTIDEILQDRAKIKELKTLDGDEALAFDDWFGSKKKEIRHSPAAPASGSNTPKSASMSRATGTPPIPSFSKKSSNAAKPAASSTPKNISSKPVVRPSERSEKHVTSKPLTSKPKASASSSSSRPSSTLPRKRARSSSRSESPYSKRRAISSEELDEEALDVSGLIWGIMGKKRSDYMKMDVFSDDEDMEVDASALEREEKRSARIAREEELAAIEEERRHEEDKKRRKMRADH